ncbi:HNH endonuclease [Agrobacterium deltaense]|uniref:HNH endonuclease n=1 Tax=Agrobacterium deltaense TaxID=1183412 RepID=UPI000F636E69|nr:HNH endonuclease signature motif containing protein [Agrobacterium deltaense]RRN75443.1 HNH endonuclease [Agrobacterium deltaense]
MPSSNTIKNLRQRAARMQGWRCFYCQLPIWNSSPEELMKRYGMPRGLTKRFQCTAEHVKAKCDGGEDVAANIVAACLFCNATRHRTKHPLDATKHAFVVRSRMAKGKWHPPQVIAALGNRGEPPV